MNERKNKALASYPLFARADFVRISNIRWELCMCPGANKNSSRPEAYVGSTHVLLVPNAAATSRITESPKADTSTCNRPPKNVSGQRAYLRSFPPPSCGEIKHPGPSAIAYGKAAVRMKEFCWTEHLVPSNEDFQLSCEFHTCSAER